METGDALSDDVLARGCFRPEARQKRLVGSVAETGDVIAERVEPDVDRLIRIAGHGDTPAASALRAARDAEVLRFAFDPRENLVPARLRNDLDLAARIKLAKLPAVTRQAEEPVFFFDLVRNRS